MSVIDICMRGCIYLIYVCMSCHVHMYVCICMCGICASLHMCVSERDMYDCMYVVRVCMCVYVCACMCVLVYARLRAITHACMHVRMYVFIAKLI